MPEMQNPNYMGDRPKVKYNPRPPLNTNREASTLERFTHSLSASSARLEDGLVRLTAMLDEISGTPPEQKNTVSGIGGNQHGGILGELEYTIAAMDLKVSALNRQIDRMQEVL